MSWEATYTLILEQYLCSYIYLFEQPELITLFAEI